MSNDHQSRASDEVRVLLWEIIVIIIDNIDIDNIDIDDIDIDIGDIDIVSMLLVLMRSGSSSEKSLSSNVIDIDNIAFYVQVIVLNILNTSWSWS